MSCAICAEDFNQTIRRRVSCTLCGHECCRACAATYLCDLPEMAKCMSCDKQWDRATLVEVMGKGFVNSKYKDSRERHLFDREMSMMPATQTKVQKILKEIRTREKVEKLMIELHSKKQQLRNFYVVDLESKKQHIQIQGEVFWLEKKIELKRFKLQNGITSQRRTFVRKCPGADCRGFLDTQWKCGICERSYCKECHEEFKVGHECDQATVATVKLMKTDSKPCPACFVSIEKIDGCDQMFCVMCNTAFSWRTGMIVTGRIHNPHYYEYLRRRDLGTVREIGDVPCGGLDNRPPTVNDSIHRQVIHGAHRLYFHIQDVTLRALAAKDTEEARVQYLMNRITEAEFKRSIQRTHKANSKKLEQRMVFTMFCEVLVDLFRNYCPDKKYQQLYSEILSLTEYTNQQFVKIAGVFDCKAPVIYSPVMSLYSPV